MISHQYAGPAAKGLESRSEICVYLGSIHKGRSQHHQSQDFVLYHLLDDVGFGPGRTRWKSRDTHQVAWHAVASSSGMVLTGCLGFMHEDQVLITANPTGLQHAQKMTWHSAGKA